jgi:hypothetical protein
VVSRQWLVAKEAVGIPPGQTQSNPVKPSQTESNQIKPAARWKVTKRPVEYWLVKPSQTQSNLLGAIGVSRNWTIRWGKNSTEGTPVKTWSNGIELRLDSPYLVKLGQTESNRIKPNQTC